MCKGDLRGCYTYISETGCVVNDYFTLSVDLYTLIHSIRELCVTRRDESGHMLLTFRVRFSNVRNAEAWLTDTVKQFAKSSIFASVKS